MRMYVSVIVVTCVGACRGQKKAADAWSWNYRWVFAVPQEELLLTLQTRRSMLREAELGPAYCTSKWPRRLQTQVHTRPIGIVSPGNLSKHRQLLSKWERSYGHLLGQPVWLQWLQDC